jgi:transglutaminase-like putative cysteine protease
MQDAAIERLSKIISDKYPDSGSRPRKSLFQFHLSMSEGWFTLFLLTTILYSTIWCVQAADWVDHLSILSLTTALGLVAGLIAAKQRRLPRLPTHLLAIGLGVLLAFWQTAGADYAGSTVALARAFHQWYLLALAGGTSNDDSIFLFLITALGFILAYTSAWLLYRTRAPWLMIVANAIVLLINLSNVESGYIVFLVVFLFASLLLLLRFNLHESVQRWRRQGLRYGDDLGWDVMQAGILISIGVLLFSWILPAGYINDTASQLWNTNSNPYIQLENEWNRLVPVSGGFTPANHGNFTDTLTLGGNPNLNNDVVFTVQTTDSTQYLESLSYDTYDPVRGWVNGPTSTTTLTSGQNIGSQSALWHPVQQTITVVNPPGEKYPYLFGASQISAVNEPAQVQTSTADGSVIAWLTRNGDLGIGQRYTVVSYVSAADVQTLRKVPLPANSPIPPTNFDGPVPSSYYDPAILKTYLQLPGGLDPAIKQLAQNIVANAHATTMWDEAEALRDYLHTNYTYDVNIHRPLASEGVSWFLFHSDRRGYCNYFASAMAIMARELGMPARVVAGYTNGQFDVKHNQWIVRGTDAHAWVQIYFATYGWVNFEPSAGFSDFERPLPGSANFTPPNLQGLTGSTSGKNNPGHGRAPNSPEDLGGTTTTPAVAQRVWRQDISLTLGGLILLILLGMALFSIWWRRLFRGRSISVQVFGRLCLLANWAGVSIQRSLTPYEYLSKLAVIAPEQTTTLERLGDIYVRDLWADPSSTEHPRHSGETQELPALWKRLQPVFFLYVVRHPYFLRWLPASFSNLLGSIVKRRRSQHTSDVKVEVDLESDLE